MPKPTTKSTPGSLDKKTQAAVDPASISEPAGRIEPLLVARSQSFTGPLPPPEILQGYESVCSGLANRIVAMAENQGDHRREQDKRLLDAEIAQVNRAIECEHQQVTRGPDPWIFDLRDRVVGRGVHCDTRRSDCGRRH